MMHTRSLRLLVPSSIQHPTNRCTPLSPRSNYWSERIAKHIDVGLKAVNGTNGNSPGQEGGPAAANILTNPVKKRASRAAGRAANTAKKRVRPVNPVARQVASPKKIRKIRYCSGNDYKLALKKIKSEIDDETDIEMPKVEYEKNIKLEPLVKREDDR